MTFFTILVSLTLSQCQYSSEISTYSQLQNCTYPLIENKKDYEHITKFLKTINEANRLIFESCESVDEYLGFLESSKKPLCRYNLSLIHI